MRTRAWPSFETHRYAMLLRMRSQLIGRARSLDAEFRELFGDVGPDGLGGGEIGFRAGAVALLLLGEAAAIEGTRELRIELERRVVVEDGLIDIAELEANEAAIAYRNRILGIDANRLGIIRNRALQLALVPIGVAAVVEGI